MKIVILLLTCIFFVSNYVCCNDSILSKFHQNGYKVKDVRIQLMSYDKNYYNFYTIKPFKYNRTTTAHNATANFKVTVADKLEALVQAYKFLSNEYRHFPVRFQVNVKKSVDSNAMGLAYIKNCGNITTFYFYKDITYTCCNFVIDETHLPPLIPNGRYRVDVHFLYLNQEIAMLSIFAEVYTPIEYPKK